MQIKSATFGQLQNNCYLVTDEASGRSALVDCTEYSDKMKDFIWRRQAGLYSADPRPF